MKKENSELKEKSTRNEQLSIYFDWLAKFKEMLVREVGPVVAAEKIMNKKNKQVKVSNFGDLSMHYLQNPSIKQIVLDVLSQEYQISEDEWNQMMEFSVKRNNEIHDILDLQNPPNPSLLPLDLTIYKDVMAKVIVIVRNEY